MIDANNTPIQNMSLLDLAMQVTGRRDIKSIDFIENGKKELTDVIVKRNAAYEKLKPMNYELVKEI